MVIKLIKTNLIEVFAVEHPRFKDHRGSFIESFNENLLILLKLLNFLIFLGQDTKIVKVDMPEY